MRAEGAAALQNYWEQMQTQVAALENALGGLQRIYHETITAGEDEGMAQLQAGDRRSHAFVSGKRDPSTGSGGAVLEATDDIEILLETLDLQRCLMIPLTSPSVASRLQALRQAQEARRSQPPPLRAHRRPHRRNAARRRRWPPAHQRAASGTVPRRPPPPRGQASKSSTCRRPPSPSTSSAAGSRTGQHASSRPPQWTPVQILRRMASE